MGVDSNVILWRSQFPEVSPGENREDKRFIIASQYDMLLRIAIKITGQFNWNKRFDFHSLNFDNKLQSHTRLVRDMLRKVVVFREKYSKFDLLTDTRRKQAITELQEVFKDLEANTIILDSKTFVETISDNHHIDSLEKKNNRGVSVKLIFGQLEDMVRLYVGTSYPVVYDKKDKVLKFTYDDDVVIKDVNLGKMTVYLSFSDIYNYYKAPVNNDSVQLKTVLKIDALNPVYPLKENFAKIDEHEEWGDIFHPHVCDNDLCFGNLMDSAQLAVNEMNIQGLCRNIQKVISSYNDKSVYVDIRKWLKGANKCRTCHECDDSFVEGEEGSRQSCGHYICNNCSSSECRDCGNIVCQECASSCNCDNDLCGDCGVTCSDSNCGVSLCSSCRSCCRECEEYFCSRHVEGGYCSRCNEDYSSCDHCGARVINEDLDRDGRCSRCTTLAACNECGDEFEEDELSPNGLCQSCLEAEDEREQGRIAAAAAADEDEDEDEDGCCSNCGEQLTDTAIALNGPSGLCSVCIVAESMREAVNGPALPEEGVPDLFGDISSETQQEETQTETPATEEPDNDATDPSIAADVSEPDLAVAG